MKTNTIMNTWSKGELSPYLDGRTDVQVYYNGAKTVENFFILPFGGLKRRPGTYYVNTVKDSAVARLIAFQFSTTQSYILEFTEQYIGVYKDRGHVQSGAADYYLDTDAENSITYLEADLFDLQFVQDADTMWIVHPSYKPQKLTRTDHDVWTLNDYAPTADVFTSADNYPSCVAIYEQRLVFANSNEDPQKIWTTKSGDYDDMTTGADADHAMVYILGSKKVNAIRWLYDSDVLFIGTLGNIFKLWSGSDDSPLTPTNVSVKRVSSLGSVGLMPQELEDFIYYVQRNTRIIREIAYTPASDKYKPNEVSVFSNHITGDGIVDMACQQAPYNMLWCVRDDGKIAVMTRQAEQQVLGWSLIITDGEVESVAIIPGDGGDDEVWVVVRRYIDGSYVRYVEYFKPTIYDDPEDGYFVDCGLTLDTPITITGITNANPAVVTATDHGLSDGDTVTIRNLVGVEDDDDVDTLAAGINGSKYKVANKTTHTFEITDTDDTDIDSTDYGVYLSGGEVRKCVTALTGLDHLEGETVAICADGAALASEEVSSGGCTADSSAGEIHAGLPYISTLKTMRLEAGQESGTAQGKLKKIAKAIIRLFETVGCNIGDGTTQDPLTFRSTDDDTDEAIPLFTGDKDIAFPGSFDEDAYVVVTQEQPLPLNILALILFFNTNEP